MKPMQSMFSLERARGGGLAARQRHALPCAACACARSSSSYTDLMRAVLLHRAPRCLDIVMLV